MYNPGYLTRANSGNIASAAWGVAGPLLAFAAATATDTSSSGAVATAAAYSIAAPTLAASAPTTYAAAATLYIAGDPVAGTNVTITAGYGLWNAGKTRLDGAVTMASTLAAASASAHTLGPITFTNGVVTALTSIAAPTATALTLTGGDSGASISLGAGANANITLTPSGTGGTATTKKITFGESLITDTKSLLFYEAGTTFYGIGAVSGQLRIFVPNSGGKIVFSGLSSADGTTFTEWGEFSPSNGNLLIGGATDISGTGGLKVFGTTDASTTTSGAFQCAGGAGIVGAAYVGGTVTITPSYRPVTAGNGAVSIKGSTGGWSIGVKFIGSAATNLGGVWGSGSSDALTSIKIGSGDFASAWATFDSSSTALVGNLSLTAATSTITLGSTNTGSIAVDANGALTVTPTSGQITTVASNLTVSGTGVSAFTSGKLAIGASNTNARDTDGGADNSQELMVYQSDALGGNISFNAFVAGAGVNFNKLNASSNNIRRVGLELIELVDTAGAETGGLGFLTKPAGSGVITAMTLGADQSLTVVGNLTASGTGTHTFGTTNTVTLAAGAITATAIGAHTFGTTNTVALTAGVVVANGTGSHIFGTTNTVSLSAGVVTATGTGSHVFGTTNTVTMAAGALTATAGFGCNTKAAQGAYASGGALAAYGAGANGFDSGANASALHALVVAIRAALVADGIMS